MNEIARKPGPESRAAPGFERAEYDIGGVRTVVQSIGSGPPLVFLHGAGTFPGFEVARAWAAKRKVVIPYHPGFGESGDANGLDTIEDYVFHYIDLFDRLGLDRFDLLGFSLGGWLAAEFGIRQPHRLRRLVLAAPIGLVVPEAPAPDLFKVPPPELPGFLARDPMVVLRHFPKQPDPAFEARLGREMGGLARLIGDQPQGNPKLARRLHRIGVPTLVIWGAEDRLRPAAQAGAWAKLLPNARKEIVPATGHLLFEETPAAAAIAADFLTH